MLEITNFSFDSMRLMARSLLEAHKMLWSMKIDIKWKLVVMSYSSRNHDIIWYKIELNRFNRYIWFDRRVYSGENVCHLMPYRNTYIFPPVFS